MRVSFSLVPVVDQGYVARVAGGYWEVVAGAAKEAAVVFEQRIFGGELLSRGAHG